ncbi:MAG: pyridine nucleotide-disulfide oxidoreductase, partial [Methylicorpusculum sp.]|nr:pyridine nucleotide-disulfide oxidoreductase [Methylicorpusculum sp.]
MTQSKMFLLLAIAVMVMVFFSFDLHQYLTLESLKSQQAAVESYRSQFPVKAVLIYFLMYITVTGLSLPGATVLTLAGGAVFGLFWGTVIVSFASTLGATLAFL